MATRKPTHSSEETEERAAARRSTINKTLAAVSILSAAAALVFRAISLSHLETLESGKLQPTGNYFVFANLMHGAVIVLIACILLLQSNQLNLYFPYLTKKKRAQLDERQLEVRHNVLEKSYAFFFLAIVSSIWFDFASLVTKDNMNFAQGDIAYPVLTAILLFIGLPSILAAFDKKS